MEIITKILITMVGIEFMYIYYLQSIISISDKTSKVFNISKKELKKEKFNILLKNQGVYNGLIGLGLFYSVYISTNEYEIARLILIYIILVALYGSLTSNKKIILTQGGLAIIALVSTFI